ncbi:MAG: 4'-phosphopantetheinyl transferase superfamily protein [Gammaproteobacteria bacterium]|nr:4'-phosphopantetheinyl transferase superfamily protein [Gammaproteobacteria bacterium]
MRKGRVDIWRIDLAQAAGDPRLIFSPSDKSGRKQGLSPAGQRAKAHRALREIVSRYLDCSPDALQFKNRPGGKPYLHAPTHQLEFNLSHSRDIALLGISTSIKLGIDVETCRAVNDPLRIAQRVMSAAECDELAALSGDLRLDRFLALWTRLEARQKAMGMGIFAESADPALLSSFSFRPDPSRYASLCLSPGRADPELRFIDYGWS